MVEKLKKETSTVCRLAVILCGNREDSKVYVRHKQKACAEVGIESELIHLFPDGVTSCPKQQGVVVQEISRLANDEKVHGILVQLPIRPMVKAPIIDSIPPEKDVDGFTPQNVGLLSHGRAVLEPCTPSGIIHLLGAYRIPIERKRVTIINNSDIVGKPLAAMMDREGATVTMCHSRTPPDMLATCTRESDIVVVAVGSPDFLNAGMIKPGAVVVDVGINRVDGKIVGDVDPRFGFKDRAGYLSPVPGGVGPLTVAMLLQNTYTAAKLQTLGR